MSEYLEVQQGKFTFRILTDRMYTAEGLWVLPETRGVRIGLSDFIQQRSGDVAFAEVKPVGTSLKIGDDLAMLETIKVNTTFGSPLSAEVMETNAELATAPELINQDPYGKGWLSILLASDWQGEMSGLLSAQTYFERVKHQAAQEEEG